MKIVRNLLGLALFAGVALSKESKIKNEKRKLLKVDLIFRAWNYRNS